MSQSRPSSGIPALKSAHVGRTSATITLSFWLVSAAVACECREIADSRDYNNPAPAAQWRIHHIFYLKAPEVTRRNTRVHFIQPLKERIVREVGYGLSLEGASGSARW